MSKHKICRNTPSLWASGTEFTNRHSHWVMSQISSRNWARLDGGSSTEEEDAQVARPQSSGEPLCLAAPTSLASTTSFAFTSPPPPPPGCFYGGGGGV